MTSEVFWNSGISTEEDLCLQDTFIMMSSADFESPPLQGDLDQCRVGMMTAPRNVGQTTDAQSVAGGNIGAQNTQGESSNVHPEAGGAPASGGGAGAGGGDDNHDSGNEGGGQAPMDDDESHEVHGTSSSSAGSGSMPVLIPPPVVLVPSQGMPLVSAPPQDEYRNGNHSDGSGGISDATTALVSDTEGHGQIIVSTANDPVPSTSRQLTTCSTTIARNLVSCDMDVLKTTSDNLDVSSAATLSTLSSFTTSSSSGREDKRSASLSDASFQLDTSKLGTSTISDHAGLMQDVPPRPVFEERVAEFHISQEDMFAGEPYTSTPSETIEILGFSQPTASETIDDDSNLIIPPSPDVFEAVPFLYPGTPSEDVGKRNLKRSLPQEFTSNDASNPRKKPGEERSLTIAVTQPVKKKPSEKGLAEAKIGRFIASRMDPRTSHEPVPEESELAASPQVSDSVACKIVFESQTSDSQEGSSDPSSRRNAITPSTIPLFKPISKETISDSTSTDSNTDTGAERPSTENLILSQLMQNIANLETPANDIQQANASAKHASGNLYCMKPKEGPRLISIGEKSVEKSPEAPLHLGTDKKGPIDSLKVTGPNLIVDSCKEQQESEEMQSDDELFLHYSPSQRMESQYFGMGDEVASGEVAESDLDSDTSTSDAKARRTKEQLEPETVPESESFECTNEPAGDSKTKDELKISKDVSSFKTCLHTEDTHLGVVKINPKKHVQQATFHLPASQAILSLENELPEEEKVSKGQKQVSEDQAVVAGPSGLQKHLAPLSFQEQMSDDCNPFDSTSEEFDAPACPVGRHKRPIVWTDDSDTPETLKQNKKIKTSSKSASCQVNIINKSSTSPCSLPNVESRDQAVQTVHEVESKAVTHIVSEACDTTDSTDIIRRTTIVTRTVIEEQLRHGKVIKKTVVETSDEPVISEFPDDGNTETRGTLFIQPTPNKASPESSGTKSGASSLNKSNSSSHTSGWLGDISSSKSSSSSSLNKATPLPLRRNPSADNASLINRASTPVEPKSISGMKTLRSVKRRQFYEFKKTLNLSSPETVSPVKKPEASPEPGSDQKSSKSSSKIHKTASPSKKLNQRKKKVAQPLIVAEEEPLLPETPVKRPGKGKKRGQQSTKMQLSTSDSNSVSSRKSVKDQHSRRPSRDKLDTSRPSTSREADVQNFPGSLRPGARVMAKWQDKFYYPGCVLQQERDDSWLIMYDDGDARSIKISKILVVDVLPVGQSVYAESADGEFDSGIILENFVEDGETIYKVEFDGGTVRNVPRSKVCLTHDQAALLEELPTNTMYGYTSICLDNIVEGKRRSRGESRETLSPSMQRLSRTPRRAKKTFHKPESPPEGERSSSEEFGQSSSNKHGAKNPKRSK